MTTEFVTLTLSGILVNLVGIAVTAWLSHRSLVRKVARVTDSQTKNFEVITSVQTRDIRQLTDAQTSELLKRRWWRRRP